MNSFARQPWRGLLLLLALMTAVVSRGAETGGEESAGEQSLYFHGGDRLKGRLVSLSAERGLQWVHPAFRKPVWFATTNVSAVHLRRPTDVRGKHAGRTVLGLANGDELMGRLLSINEEFFELETSYAGRLEVPKNRVRTLWPHGTNRFSLYEGPLVDSEWTHGDISAGQGVNVGRWTFLNGSFVSASAASVARNLNLPNDVRIDFRLQWQGMFSLAIGLHTDSLEPISLNARHLEPDFAPFYSLWINQSQTELRVVPKEGDIRQLDRANLNHLPQTTNAVFSIFGSEHRKSVTLMLNGRVIKEWVDPAGWSAGGTGIRFVHQGYGSVRLSELRASRWDGKAFTPPLTVSHPSLDVMLRAGKNVSAGKLQGLTNGVFRFETGGEVESIPFAAVGQLNFAKNLLDASSATNGVTVDLVGRGRISGQLLELDDQRAKIASPALGDLRLKRDLLVRLLFER